ncbi:hypothetical protein EYB25_004094 [Talaromyces marneffei]|uniref:uncharacterized protein n=1 Tax=Talaromyces marneffei TaxID=37727 RepID=UPI0012A7CED7|nr:uncharacterized protein EYB26_004819 [Talaromyces marneffei]KAE8552715.1 hypothetical protein EYB25_004094 [Talaromyces marneffei]QGA17149.1 hypothetical protein EYB26_004819 [Talaromyces marneffei]
MAEDHSVSGSATTTLNNEDNHNNNTTTIHQSEKMNIEAASIDTTTTMETHNNIEKENERGHTFNHDISDEEEDFSSNPKKVQDATAGQMDLTRTTSSVRYVEGMKLYILMASMTLIFFLVMVDISIVSTAVPKITSDFNSLEDVGWYGTAYQLACASLQPLAGKVYSNFRPKSIYLVCFLIFEIGSLICGVAQSSTMLIIGRAIAGIGSSGLMNGALTILSTSMPLHKRPTYFGIMMGFAQMGTILGPIIGGAFTTYVNWRWCFYINLPVGGVAGAIMLFFIQVPDVVKPRTESIMTIITRKLDIMGFFLFAPAAIQVFLALEWGGSKYAWNSATIIGLFCGSGATIILFGVWEYYQGDNAMAPFSILKIRHVWASCLVMFLFFGCLQIASYYLPIYFQTVRGSTAIVSGVHMLPNVLSQLISTVASGAFVGRLGYYLPWIIASSTLSAVALGLLSTFSPTTSAGEWIGYQVLLGFSRGLGMQMPIIAVQNSINPKFVPVAMALVTFGQTFGGAVFLAIGETILSNQLRTNIPKYAPGVDTASIIAAGGSGPAVRAAVGDNPVGLAGTLLAYSKSVDAVYWFAASAAAVMFVASWGMGWKDIRKKDAPPKVDVESAAAAC